jgi:hypothetical protein
MKLTIPAIRPAAPDTHRQEVSELTVNLLKEIDAVLSESLVSARATVERRTGRRAYPRSPAVA